ncbi:hypothetical protein HDU82_001513 [Entophlyctis luteolus]|nr:hypothetical protein HDU82_001513 [Entophlyctis luteolus]
MQSLRWARPRPPPHSQPTLRRRLHASALSPSSTTRGFYQNAVVEKYSARESKLVTLRQLTVFGRSLTLDKLLRSANYVREELPVRLAHRIIDMQRLPFIVGTNPHIQLIYSLYWQAFESFRTFPEIKSIEENRAFCRLIESQLQTHLVVIPQLAMGMADASTSEHLSSEAADRFLNEMLKSRIGRRVLAEQHIALSDTYDQTGGGRALIDEDDGWIGIVNTRCRAADVVDRVSIIAKRWFHDTYSKCKAEPPEILVDGHAGAVFSYIPDHIEYILFELLKNSMRFTLETHGSTDENLVARTQLVQNVLDDDRLFGLTWNEPGILPGYSNARRRRSYNFEQSAPIYGSGPSLTHLEPINPNHILPARPPHDLESKKNSDEAKTDRKLPPIRVTVGSSRSDITFRVSDEGGGFRHSQMENLWSYTHASRNVFLNNLANMPKLAGKVEEVRRVGEKSDSPTTSGRLFELEENTLHLGLGLPMSRVYANYWGGTIGVHSMHGYGTDAYVKISLGNQMEQLTHKSGDGLA